MSTSTVSTTFSTTNPSASLPSYPTAAEILIGIQQSVQKLNGLITNFNAGGVTETYLEGLSILLGSDSSTLPNVTIEGAYELLATVAESAYASTAKGPALDLKGLDVGVERKQATTATAPLQFALPQPATAPGYVIAANTICSANPADPTQGPILFQTTEAVVVPTGQTLAPNTVPSVAMVAGSNGNVIAGAINTCITNGQLIVTNPGKASGGTDTEIDDGNDGGYRKRVLAAIPNSSQCTIAAIENDALAFPITSAVLVENTADDGVTRELGRGQLYIDDGSGDLGSSSNPNYASFVALQNAFDTGLYRAAGTQVHVRGSESVAVVISLSITASTQAITLGASEASIASDVQSAIYSYVQSLVMGHPVDVASIVAIAKNVLYNGGDTNEVANVNVSSVLINGSNSDFTPQVYQLPRVLPNISSITVNVTGVSSYV
jgi:uncharacterized phage protein gp47/JayE